MQAFSGRPVTASVYYFPADLLAGRALRVVRKLWKSLVLVPSTPKGKQQKHGSQEGFRDGPRGQGCLAGTQPKVHFPTTA